MNIKKGGSQPSAKGPAEWFTGPVRIDSPFQGGAPARVAGAIVTFEPGAHTAWHTHPLGQTLIVDGDDACGYPRATRWQGRGLAGALAQAHPRQAVIEARIAAQALPLGRDGEMHQRRIVAVDRSIQVPECRV
jgi:hypothetical protein